MKSRTAVWRVTQVLIIIAAAHACWRLFGHVPYRIDVDVYRMGGRAWLDGQPLYADGAIFRTQAGLELPFTYPPLAAIGFSPLAVVPLPVASLAITAVTALLAVLSIWLILTRLDVGAGWAPAGPAWARRVWLAAGIVAVSTTTLEPIRANFSFGQINVVLMTLVIADCVPRTTKWPRGVLVGLAIAPKLTPAVFLLYFVLRRDVRATLWAGVSFVVATALGGVLAWRDSVEYWTTTVRHTDRIGNATLNTNQNIAGALALALACVALFGLVVSPVSWSHHWVWGLPVCTVLAVLAYRRRNPALAVLAAAGLILMMWSPIGLLPEHQEISAAWWRQLLGMSYVWWAVSVIVAAGLTVTRAGSATRQRSPGSAPTDRLVRPV